MKIVKKIQDKLREVITLVGSESSGSSINEFYMFLEIVPGESADVIRKSIKKCSHAGSRINNAIGCESLHDAVIRSEEVGLSLLKNIKPENLFFFFSERIEFFDYVMFQLPLDSNAIKELTKELTCANYKQCSSKYKINSEPLAVVLCKLKNIEEFEDMIGNKETKSCNSSQCYKITWRELNNLKNKIKNNCRHRISSKK